MPCVPQPCSCSGPANLALHTLGTVPASCAPAVSADDVRKRVARYIGRLAGPTPIWPTAAINAGADPPAAPAPGCSVRRVKPPARWTGAYTIAPRRPPPSTTVHYASEDALIELAPDQFGRERARASGPSLRPALCRGRFPGGRRRGAESVERPVTIPRDFARSASRTATRAPAPRRPSTATRTRRARPAVVPRRFGPEPVDGANPPHPARSMSRVGLGSGRRRPVSRRPASRPAAPVSASWGPAPKPRSCSPRRWHVREGSPPPPAGSLASRARRHRPSAMATHSGCVGSRRQFGGQLGGVRRPAPYYEGLGDDLPALAGSQPAIPAGSDRHRGRFCSA